MNRQITEAELRKRFTKENTETIALRCLFCGNIDEVEAGFVDGRQCSVCKKHVSPIGYLKPKQNPHNNNQKLKKQVKSMDTKEHVDKLIVSLCGYIQKVIESDEKFIKGKDITENIKALAELESARALKGGD